jgi:hypothetical protein
MISFGPLAKCEARELVQARMGDAVEWAIVGAKAPGYFPFVVFALRL